MSTDAGKLFVDGSNSNDNTARAQSESALFSTLPVVAGSTYIFSADIMPGTGTGQRAILFSKNSAGANTQIASLSASGSASVTIPSDVASLEIWLRVGAGNSAWYDNLTLTQTSGATARTIDPITSISSSSSSSIVSSSSVSSTAATISDGTYPSSPDQVGDYTKPIDTTGAVSVLDYGAKANDPSFNNTSAFQSALNANAKVYVPAGVFYFNSGSTLKMTTANHLIYGEGTLKTNGTGRRVVFKAAYFDTIEDLVIDGLSFINMGVGCNQVYVRNLTVQNCYFEVTADYAEYMTSSVLGLNFDLRTVDDMYFHSIHFNNNTFKNCSRSAIEILNQHKNMDTRGPAGVLDSTRITDIQIKGNVFTFDEGFYRNPDLSAAISSPEMCNLTIEDNYIDGYYWGLELGTLDDGKNFVINNYIKAGLVLASDDWTAIRNVTIDSNYLEAYEPTYSGSYYFGYILNINSGGKGGVVLTNNTIIGSVNVVESDDIVISGNTIKGGHANTGTETGLYVGDSSDNSNNGHIIRLKNSHNATISANRLSGGRIQYGIRAIDGSTGNASDNTYDSLVTTMIRNDDGEVLDDGGNTKE